MQRGLDETWCGFLSCPHPACWQSKRRIVRQKPKHMHIQEKPRQYIDELPTQKIQNVSALLEDDFPMAETSRDRAAAYLSYIQNRSKRGSPDINSSLKSNRSSDKSLPDSGRSKKIHPLDAQQTFSFDKKPDFPTSRPYYVWVPNPLKVGDKVDKDKKMNSLDDFPIFQLAPVMSRDATELFLPKYSEKENIISDPRQCRSPYVQHSSNRSPRVTPRSTYRDGIPMSQSVQDSITNLMGLPANVLSDVLDQIEKGELLSRENFNRLVGSASDQGVDTNHPDFIKFKDILVQRKMILRSPSGRFDRNPDFYNAKQIFRLDDSQPLPPRVNDPLQLSRPSSYLPSINLTTPPPMATIGNVGTEAPPPSRRLTKLPSVRNYREQRMGQGISLMLAPVSSFPSGVDGSPCMTPYTEDSASINVTMSTDRSTLYHEILPVSKQTTEVSKIVGSREDKSSLSISKPGSIIEQIPDKTETQDSVFLTQSTGQEAKSASHLPSSQDWTTQPPESHSPQPIALESDRLPLPPHPSPAGRRKQSDIPDEGDTESRALEYTTDDMTHTFESEDAAAEYTRRLYETIESGASYNILNSTLDTAEYRRGLDATGESERFDMTGEYTMNSILDTEEYRQGLDTMEGTGEQTLGSSLENVEYKKQLEGYDTEGNSTLNTEEGLVNVNTLEHDDELMREKE